MNLGTPYCYRCSPSRIGCRERRPSARWPCGYQYPRPRWVENGRGVLRSRGQQEHPWDLTLRDVETIKSGGAWALLFPCCSLIGKTGFTARRSRNPNSRFQIPEACGENKSPDGESSRAAKKLTNSSIEVSTKGVRVFLDSPLTANPERRLNNMTVNQGYDPRRTTMVQLFR
jgi:hypothetical protein